MNRALARIRLQFFASYYRRVVTQAVREATHPWLARLSVSAVLAVLTFVFSWVITGRSALTGLAVAGAALGGWWCLVFAWFLVTTPPRIEAEMRRKEETLRVLSQRRNVANELRNHMIACRQEARRAREAEIQASGQGGTIFPDAYHQTALRAAKDAAERLERLSKQPGQRASNESYILEITDAVRSRTCANADEAIAQLEALADVFERQLTNGTYW